MLMMLACWGNEVADAMFSILDEWLGRVICQANEILSDYDACFYVVRPS